MEGAMQFKLVLISTLAFGGLSCGAQAAKFTCDFTKDGSSVKTCTIDSDTPTPGNLCQFDYSATVKGSCFGVPFLDPVVVLACAFHDPALKP
jgi:hypothetical protein